MVKRCGCGGSAKTCVRIEKCYHFSVLRVNHNQCNDYNEHFVILYEAKSFYKRAYRAVAVPICLGSYI
jgi:hypothetical protein